MKTTLRPLLLCAALAGLVPPTLAAFADNPPAGDNPPAAVAATPPESAAKAPAAAPESAPPPAAPAAPTASESTSTAPSAATAETPSTPTAAAAKSESDSSLRPLDRPTTAESTETTSTDSSSSVRRSRRHSSDNERVTFGGNAELAKGEVANSVVAIAGNARSAGEVTDSVVAIAGNAHVTGPVSQSVVAVFGNVFVDAKVGEVVAVLGNVELGPNAEVQHDVVSVLGTVKRDPNAIVHGGMPTVSVGPFGFNADWLQSYLKNCLFKARLLAFGPNLAWAWYVAIGFLFLYVVLGLLFGSGITACAQTLETRPGGSILASLLALLLTPVLIVLLCITVVGIAVVPFIGIALVCANLFGKAVMLGWIGRRITRLFGDGPLSHPAFAVLLGGLIVMALYLVPFVGLIVYKLLGVLGLGVVIYTLLLANKRDKAARAAAAPVYAAPVPPPVGGASAAFTDATGATVIGAPAVASATAAPVAATALLRAGFWVRTGALLIDVILVGVVVSVLPHWLHLHPPGMLLLLAIYGAVLWKLRGTTVGGIVCGLRVVRTDGREMDWATAVVRALGCFLSLIAVGLGFIWVAIDDEKQSWHDKIAGTTVVFSRGNHSLV